MDLSPSAYVILGMLRHQPRTGYEIKQTVDRSTRFFWAASYGQIYPELRRLEAAGLVAGESKPSGARKRTVYRLTRGGRKQLREWLDRPPQTYELREESILKLFFAAAARPGRPLELVEARRRHYEQLRDELRAIEPHVRALPDPFPYLALTCGLSYSESAIAWCEQAMATLTEAEPTGSDRVERGEAAIETRSPS